MDANRINSYVGQDAIILKDGEGCKEFIDFLYKPYWGGDPLLDSISEHDRILFFTMYKKILYKIAKYIKPKLVVELGVREARSSDTFTRVVSTTGGKVYSFDPTPIGHTFMGPYTDYWEFHPCTGEHGYVQMGETIKNIDMLFIDTDPHSKVQMDMWLSQYWIKNVKSGGFIVADDAAPQNDELVSGQNYEHIWRPVRNYGVFSSLLEYVDRESASIEYAFTVYNNHANGFAVVKLI